MASSEAHKAYMREYYVKNRAKVLATNERWREKNREVHLSGARGYHNANKDEINARRRAHRKENPEHYRVLRHQRLYGVMPADFELMRGEQEGRCAICCEEAPLVVDHCHETEYVRALLCSQCNTAIGLLKDDPERARQAMVYLEKHAMMKAKGGRSQVRHEARGASMTVLMTLEDAPEGFDEGLFFRRYDSAFAPGLTHQGGIKFGTTPITGGVIERLRVSPPNACRVQYLNDDEEPPAAA